MNGKKPILGLALAGGGPAGSVYEIGAIRALEEAIEGLSFNDFDVYVGVSAGAVIASNLANGLTTKQMCRAIVKTDPGEHPFTPEIFFMPAAREYLRSFTGLPRVIKAAIEDYLGNREDRGVFKSLTVFSRAMPLGLFDNRPIKRYMEKIFSRKDRTDDFRKLPKKLFIVAADLDAGEAVIFGKEGWDHIPISTAVQASTALPGLYPPVLIDGRHYVDGVLLKTLHASTVLDQGADLTLCVNPIVPVDTRMSVEQGYMRRGKLVDRGMPTVLEQTFRTLIHSRLTTGLAAYGERYRDKGVILFEPSKEDYRMFFTNIFSFSSRKWVCEHAYESTLRDLGRRRDELAPRLAKYGLRLREDLLDSPDNLWDTVELPSERRGHETTHKLDRALTILERKLAKRKQVAN